MLVQTAVPLSAELAWSCAWAGSSDVGGVTHPSMELREGTEAGPALDSPCRYLAGFNAPQTPVSGLGGLSRESSRSLCSSRGLF